ncbi:MAG: type II secretion system F family protein [Candidatus Micrarchaeota archaeon]|nr:type II secretion system F family protein [Candidatus Micrarchaeota archaeon]
MADDKDIMDKEIIGFTKPKKFLFFKIPSRPIYGKRGQKAAQQQQPTQQPSQAQQKPQHPGFKLPFGTKPSQKQQQQVPQQKQVPHIDYSGSPQSAQHKATNQLSGLDNYLTKVISKQKNFEIMLKDQGIKATPLAFARRMFIFAVLTCIAMGILLTLVIYLAKGLTPLIIVGPVLGAVIFTPVFNTLLNYTKMQTANKGKDIERDVLYAARDMIISMRSGLPLYNAIATVSQGYGAASAEFAKVIEYAQLGMPIEEAIDTVSQRSGSKTFKRLMLQASMSIKAGVDIVSTLQEEINEASQERTIELRRYGQRLNALAMFYMLFGVIFPSMGIAVASILTTFIAIFTINNTTLIFVLVGIFFLQFIFLNLIKASRPIFVT